MNINFVMGLVNPFFVNVSKMNVTASNAVRKTTPHIHEYCEIYVNVTGNVSFMIEKNLYSVKSGDIIITKPYEYHHCVYHDDSDHLHFWIMFSVDENPELAMMYRIASVPTLMVFSGGDVVKQALGAMPKKDILALLP